MAIPGVTSFTNLAAGDEALSLFDSSFQAVQNYVDYKTSTSVSTYGAVGNGIIDDTAAIQAAINALAAAGAYGGDVYFPPGVYLVSAPIQVIHDHINLVGEGPNSSVIITNNTTANLVNASGYGTQISRLGFSVPAGSYTSYIFNSVSYLIGPQIGGYMLNMTGVDQYIENVEISGFYVGINLNGDAVTLVDVILSHPGIGGYGVNFDSGAAPTFATRVQCNGNGKSAAGFNITTCSAINITDCGVIGMGAQLAIEPGAGVQIDSLWVLQTDFDNGPGFPSQNGIVIDAPTSTSVVQRCHFIGCWTSSHTNQGFLISNTGAGTISGIEISGHESYGNSSDGLNLLGGTGITIEGGTFSGNAGDGVTVGADVTDFTITGIQAGGYGWTSGNTGYGINVLTGASDRYIITNNRTTGNTLGGVNDNGSGMNKVVTNNIT